MDQILRGLLVPSLVPLSSLITGQAPEKMAAAAVSSSSLSSQEQHSLPFRPVLDRNPFDPPPSAQQIRDNTSGQFDLQDIADFDLEHPFQAPTTTGSKLLRLPRKGKCENIEKLQHRADKLQIRPEYQCDEVLPQNFKAKVAFNGATFEAVGLFPSKDQARDAAAKLALESLPPLESKQAAGVKRKGDDRSPTPVDKSENWIGILEKNHAQKKKFEPDYDEYQVAGCTPTFVCKLRLNGGPLEPFASGELSQKKDAKKASAKLGVEWLRSEGHLDTPTPVKRLKKAEEADGHTGLTQAVRNVDIDMEMDTKLQSFRQRVYELAAALGFQQPSCEPKLCLVNGVPAGSFYDAASIFRDVDVKREPTLAGPIGQVKHVFGKNKAKEACSERVLPVLEAIKQMRLAAF